MLCFDSDYMEGAHPLILDSLSKTNMEKLPGYGTDKYCLSAAKKIKEACDCPEAQVFFISGGTQTNKTVLDSLLKKFEGVISADTGHIAVHEAGAIEACGHKVITLKNNEGKLSAESVESYLEKFYADDTHGHMVSPGAVYISYPTEYGTLYSIEELEGLYTVCNEYSIPLFIDGARLGYGLAADKTVTLADIARLCDVFYIGGTKVGALCGEAVVFTKGNMPSHFVTSVKQNGALLAKGRLLGIQFDTLFTDNLYMSISENAVKRADEIKKALKEKGYRLHMENPTNQVFVILENEKMKELRKKVSFGFWEIFDSDHTVVRFASSWATSESEVKALAKLL